MQIKNDIQEDCPNITISSALKINDNFQFEKKQDHAILKTLQKQTIYEDESYNESIIKNDVTNKKIN